MFWLNVKVSLSMEDLDSVMPGNICRDSIVTALNWISKFKTVVFGDGTLCFMDCCLSSRNTVHTKLLVRAVLALENCHALWNKTAFVQ